VRRHRQPGDALIPHAAQRVPAAEHAGPVDDETRDYERQLVKPGHARIVQVFPCERLHADGDVLEVLLNPARGDNDFRVQCRGRCLGSLCRD
jgi:hypothetical protein